MVTLRHLTKDLAKPGAMQGKAGVTARRQEKGREVNACAGWISFRMHTRKVRKVTSPM